MSSLGSLTNRIVKSLSGSKDSSTIVLPDGTEAFDVNSVKNDNSTAGLLSRFLGGTLFNSPSLPSTAGSLISSVGNSLMGKDVSDYDNYLSMIQEGANLGLFSTAQDVRNEAIIDRQFQAEEAQKERDWYENMSNTAVQRQVQDLQAAGINPILGFSHLGSGASTAATAVPSGTSSGLRSVAPSLADYMNAGSNIMSSASKVIGSLAQAFVAYKKFA